jgi:hypothetical protein
MGFFSRMMGRPAAPAPAKYKVVSRKTKMEYEAKYKPGMKKFHADKKNGDPGPEDADFGSDTPNANNPSVLKALDSRGYDLYQYDERGKGNRWFGVDPEAAKWQRLTPGPSKAKVTPARPTSQLDEYEQTRQVAASSTWLGHRRNEPMPAQAKVEAVGRSRLNALKKAGYSVDPSNANERLSAAVWKGKNLSPMAKVAPGPSTRVPPVGVSGDPIHDAAERPKVAPKAASYGATPSFVKNSAVIPKVTPKQSAQPSGGGSSWQYDYSDPPAAPKVAPKSKAAPAARSAPAAQAAPKVKAAPKARSTPIPSSVAAAMPPPVVGTPEAEAVVNPKPKKPKTAKKAKVAAPGK